MMNVLNFGGLILALAAFIYAMQLGRQLRKVRRKIDELERVEAELLKKK